MSSIVPDYKRRLFEVFDNDELKKLYVQAAIDTYKLTHLEAYINRKNDIILSSQGATLGGFLFIPAYVLKAYIEKNRGN